MSQAARRYQRKDYSQLVEFPVEIVGRDNLVRRYSFDEAVRLYQRRIHSARVRFDDPEMIGAEVQHCRARITQLRRSYIEHTGWGWARDTGVRGILGSPLAAEVAAFVRRAFSEDPSVLTGLSLTLVHSGPGDVCFLKPGRGDGAYLLYAWRFDEGVSARARDEAREDFARVRTRLAGVPAGSGQERALYVQDGADVALLLAGDGDWTAPDAEEADAPPTVIGPPADPWREATRALHDGDLPEALRRFEAALDSQPERRAFAVSAAVLALQSGEPERAEFAARTGLLHHPDDPRLLHMKATALLRSGRRDEALADVEVALGRPAGRDPGLLLIGALADARRGRWVRATRRLAQASRLAANGPWFLHRAAQTARAWLFAAACGAVASALALALLGWALRTRDTPLAVASGAILPLALVTCGRPWFRLSRALTSSRFDVVRLVSPELLPRDGEPDAVH